jgi:hypothetical protein
MSNNLLSEIAKLPKEQPMVRSAYSMSKETTEHLRRYAKEHKLPIQALVEVSVIKLLDRYDIKK